MEVTLKKEINDLTSKDEILLSLKTLDSNGTDINIKSLLGFIFCGKCFAVYIYTSETK